MARSLKTTQAAIASNKLKWTAGKTTMYELVDAERKRMLGYKANLQEREALADVVKAANSFQAHLPQPALPASVDWRTGNWITGVKDQGSCGACVSFATVGTIESLLRIARGNPQFQIDLSEAHLFFCGCSNCCDPGWNFVPAFEVCRTMGIADESAWPYQPHDTACRSGLSPIVKVTSWTRLYSSQERKDALAHKGPVVAGMAVYDDFYQYMSGVYEVTSNTLSGRLC